MVREFLESDRSSSTSWFSIKRKDSYSLILNFVLEYAITSELIEIPENWNYDDSPLYLTSSSSLQEYCTTTSIRSLLDYEELVEPGLAFRFLDPLEAHFDAAHWAVCRLELNDDIDILSSNFVSEGFWIVDWHKSTETSKTAILANLLLMECFDLAKDFIQDLDVKSAVQETLFGSFNELVSWALSSDSNEFACNLVEFLAATRKFGEVMLEFFEQEAYGLICYTNLMPYYMPNHICKTVCESSCVLPRLLLLGANPDPKGFWVTPLQIAVFSRDIAGVRTLLEAGAGANNIGDKQGVEFSAKTALPERYCHLHGLTPLFILWEFEAKPYYNGMPEEKIALYTTGIERLLLGHGASTVSVENGE